MTDDQDERAERLRSTTEDLLTTAARRKEARGWASKQVTDVRGNAATTDGAVRAAVDHTGMLVWLELAPEVQQAQPQQLARVVTATVQRAVADARNQIREIYVSLQNEGILRELPASLPVAPAVEQTSLTTTTQPQGSPGDSTRLGARHPGRPRDADRPGGRGGHDEGPPDSWMTDTANW